MCPARLQREVPRQSEKQILRQDLLTDARGRLRSKLPLTEVVALRQLVELLDVPALMIQLEEFLVRELVLVKTRYETGHPTGSILHLQPSEIQRQPRRISRVGRTQANPSVEATTLAQGVHGFEATTRGQSNQEVDLRGPQSLDHFMRGVPAIEHYDVSLLEMLQEGEKLRTLARVVG